MARRRTSHASIGQRPYGVGMVKQERAVRTRAAVLRAAAAEFDRSGYGGTSLSRIGSTAGLSVGALTFHFASKAELADAVLEEGRLITRTAVDRVTAKSGPALSTIVELTLELARLMEEETSVRSAIRLSRERPASPNWSDSWLPVVRGLLEEAHRSGQLREGALPGDVTTLVEHLTSGAEAYLRSRTGTDLDNQGTVARLERVWGLVLAGVSACSAPSPA